jgi:DNA helicase-4
MRIQPKPFLSFLFNPLGKHAKAVEHHANELLVANPRDKKLHLRNVAAPIAISKGLFGSTINISIDDGSEITLKGVNHDQAIIFSKNVREAWVGLNIGAFEQRREEIDVILTVLAELDQPTQYPAACIMLPTLNEARTLHTTLLSKLPSEAIGEAKSSQIQKIHGFIQNPQSSRERAIAQFEQQELKRWREFFDTFEKNPLTPEQRLSIIADEDATLILAGAGSGKTSVITAKAAYLLKSGIRRPEEILLLAYAKDAATEMSERVEERCGEPLAARTFHALAYDIIGAVEGNKPALVAYATDEAAFSALIKEILKALVATVSEVSKSIIGWFSYARLEEKSEWDFKKKHDYYTYIEMADLRTLQGEQVKSFEELMIANWLYENGVEYEYEPDYEHEIPNTGRRTYCPDFRLKESGIYIEHFGVRRKKAQDGSDYLTTAPYVDRDEYLTGMDWKREVHSSHKTTLIETFSYEREEGHLLTALAEKIAPFETLRPRSGETIFDRVVELKQIDGFVKMLGTFLKHYKGGGYDLTECEAKGKELRLGRRASAFLSIFGPVFQEYQSRLGHRIDFEDMILRASAYVEGGQYKSRYRHILVDEFQDISRSRGRLVKALKAQHQDARVFAVGDDWQSIYRFAGSDINLMRNFGKEFGGIFDGQQSIHRTVDLGRTFRSVDKIAFAARKFVLKNPAQITKTVIPAGVATEPAIKVVSTFRHDEDKKLKTVLQRLSQQGKSSILLLGRYKFDKPDSLRNWKRQFPNLDIAFKTIHSSKGLEADHVVILNLNRSRAGFPSEIVDDPLLTLVSPDAEPFKNAEERRVMYVAMTRARYTLTLMSSASRQSTFVSELLKDPQYGIVKASKDEEHTRTCTECGGQLFALSKKDGGIWYKCEHTDLCGHTLSACSKCNVTLPKRGISSTVAKCSCGASYPVCPKCPKGWLVEVPGKFGPFLSCVRYPKCDGKKNNRKKRPRQPMARSR